ncbi:hypothetical protein [Rossellomorea sp. NRS-1567]
MEEIILLLFSGIFTKILHLLIENSWVHLDGMVKRMQKALFA